MADMIMGVFMYGQSVVVILTLVPGLGFCCSFVISHVVNTLKYIHVEKIPEVDNEKRGTEEFKLLHDCGGCCPASLCDS